MLNGHMVRERLRIPDLDELNQVKLWILLKMPYYLISVLLY